MKTNYPNVNVITEQIDLTKLADAKEFEVFKKKLNSHKIGICFNNAGIAEYNVNRWLRNDPQHIIE